MRTVRGNTRTVLAVAAAVVAISALHYITSFHSLVLHEVFKRLYYLPIVVSAVMLGTRGALATSAFSTVLYLPHVVLQLHAWHAMDAEQYGEALMFNLVALVTGGLADRLHSQRERYQDAAARLNDAYVALEARTEERQRVDRLVTVGRIASGIAHEIRTPLASVLGSLEILAAEFEPDHPKTEFVQIAKQQISRLQQVVAEFLDFAHPPPPAVRATDLRMVAQGAAGLARPALACRGLQLDTSLPERPLTVEIDAEQVQRALVTIMVASAPALREGRMTLTIAEHDDLAHVAIELHGAVTLPPAGEMFEPFRASGPGHGLGLATAARLVTNQRGIVRGDIIDGRLRYDIALPVVPTARPRRAVVDSHAS